MTNGFCIHGNILESYTLRDKIAVIPEGIEIIGENAFKGCISLEEVVIPETVTAIMDGAFKGCRKLKRVNFPSGLIHIGEYAFHRCHDLLGIELPTAVKSLGNCTFLYCDSLEYVSIPGVTRFGKQVFLNDVNIQTLVLSENVDLSCICDVFTGCGRVAEIRIFEGKVYHIDNLIDVLSSESNMPLLVKTIVNDIFKMMEIQDGTLIKFLTNLKHVEVPEGITALGNSCFFDKKGIISVRLPSSLKKIGSRAFRNCINLEKVIFDTDAVTIENDAFKNCTTLKYVITADRTEYFLSGLPDECGMNLPLAVHTLHSQLFSNFYIVGTALLKYRGNEERVVIPDGITVIGEKAFSGNEAIGKVILPDSVKEIQSEAFSDCLLLQTINLPDGLEHIGESAFENCLKLIYIDLPESIMIIEKSVFNRCKNLNRVSFGSRIKEIGSLAFYACHALKNVQLPDGIEKIGDMAFYKCLSLKEAVLPAFLKKLGNNVFTASGIKTAVQKGDIKQCGTGVFSQCIKLKKLIFEEGVSYIGDKYAFLSTSLQYVDLPAGLTYIGKNAFEGSIYLNTINKENKANNENKESDNRLTKLQPYMAAANIFIDGSRLSGEVVIPDGIIAIAGGAFYGNVEITKITFPSSLRRIGKSAFCGCKMLKEIMLPEEITILEEGVFSYCTSLEAVYCKGKIHSVGDNAFYGCIKLQQIMISEAEYIGKNAFNGCRQLELETAGLTCSVIKEDAFRNTFIIEQLQKESPLAVISNIVIDGKAAPYNNLYNISSEIHPAADISKDICTTNYQAMPKAGAGYIIIPEGIVSISPYAFAGNEDITHVVFPKSLKEIGEGAFSGCKGLKGICFQSEINLIGQKAFEKCILITDISCKLREAGEGAFSYCINLRNVSLNGLEVLSKEMFGGCTALETCVCNGLQIISEGCFKGCNSLEDFDFSRIRLIGAYAFCGCESIKALLVGGLYIEAHAFEDCTCLEELTLTQDELRYGNSVFSGCTKLNSIYIGKEHYEIGSYHTIFDRNIPSSVKLIYASAISCFAIDENLSLNGYMNQGSIVYIPDGIKSIGDEVFKNAMYLEEVHIPESVEYIGSRAFSGTPWLKRKSRSCPMVVINDILIDASMCEGEVVIPDYVKMISGWAFAGCFDVTGVTFTTDRIVVKEYAFRNCINIKHVTDAKGTVYYLTGISDREKVLPPIVKQIFEESLNCFKTDEENVLVECTGNIAYLVMPRGIKRIGSSVFKNSNLLTHIVFTEDIVSIGEYAFEQCKWLVSAKNLINVTSIGRLAFSGCYSLEDIELSDKLMTIGERAFEHCTSLKSIIIPEGIVEIPERAFFRCKSLKYISLPSTLKIIGKDAFACCDNLTDMQFPKGFGG